MKHRRVLIFSFVIVALLVGGCGLPVWQAKRQYTLNRELIAALGNDDTNQALALVNAGADPNTRFFQPPVPSLKLLLLELLHRSSLPRDDSPSAFMAACGANWNPPHVVGIPYLTAEENLHLLQLMMAHGANVHIQAEDKRTALHGAAFMGRLNTMELLLQHGANVNAQDDGGQTPLMMALHGRSEFAHQGHNVDTVRLLISHGALPNMQNEYGGTALSYAVSLSDATQIIPLLLEAWPKSRPTSSKSPKE